MLNALPAQFEDQERTDFSDAACENFAIAAGVAAILDWHGRTPRLYQIPNCTYSAF
jgi:hypothetical protein